jgi:hypothetical protein
MSLTSAGTFANKQRELYATADQAADNWYKFPSQNGEVLLVDASGTQLLHSIDANLYYNNELLAKANDIQDIADWSLYPVINPAGVDFNASPVYGVTTIAATGDISGGGVLTVGGNIVGGGSLTVPGDISGGGALAVTGILSGSEVTVTGAIQGTSLLVATLPKPIAPGEIQGDSLSVSGAAAVGSVSSTGAISGTSITGSGAIQGASLTTTGGLDMSNTAITRASSIAINNSGFPPYGVITSPNGTQLLWNGSTINTGGAGDVSQWANYVAVAPIQGNGQTLSNVASISTTGNITSSAGNLLLTKTNSLLGADNLQQIYNPTDNFPLTVAAANPAGLLINSANGGIASVASAGKIESTATGDVNLTTTGGDINVTAYDQIIVKSGNDILLTADPGINPLYTAAINLNAKNGNGGQINIVADPGSVAAFGGVVNITGNGGTIMIPQEPPAPPISVTVGGEVNITANTNASGLYTLTSAVNIAASCINSYAGVVSPLASVAGYNFIYGTAGVNVCAGLPSAGFQLPFTTYIYGTGVPLSYGGVRLQSPNGIQMLSDTYMTNLYPLDTGGLTIGGRSFLGTANVTIEDVQTLTAVSGSGQVKTDLLNSVGGGGIAYLDNLYPTTGKGLFANFVKPNMATAAGVPNLTISGNQNILGGYQNYVEIQNADVIAFDPAAAGSLTGVKSINGAAWPPPTGDASLWSQYFATSTIDASNNGIINLTTINGQPVGDLTPAGWAAFNAIQNVDLSANNLNNVGGINTVAGAAITSAGSLGIFTDAADLSLAADNGGNVAIGTGNAGSITISTGGTGHNLTLGGDVVYLIGTEVNIGTANSGDINIATNGAGNDVTIAGDIVELTGTQGVRINSRLDMAANDIIDVATLRGSLNTPMTISTNDTGLLNLQSDTGGTLITSTGSVTITAAGNTNIDSTSGSVVTTAFNSVDLTATNGAVNITANTQVDISAPLINLNANVNANGAFTGTSVSVTGDVVSSSAGSTPYSLNTIGGLVNANQQYNFYVAVNGSDSTGTGSAIRPFASVTRALAATAAITDSIPVNICLTAGTFTENPTISRNNTFIVGNVGVADAVIIGTVTFDPAATATVSQGMSGITVVGNVVCNDSIASDINWYIQFCNITSYTAAAINAFSTGSGNNSLILNNTVVTQNVTTNTAITINSVRLNAIQVQINNNTTGACISANGTGSMSVYGCTLTSAGAAGASAHITYINAVSNGSASSFVLNTFTYTAATVGAGKAAFFFNNAGALAGSTVINNNVFNLPGAAGLILRPGAGSIAIAWGANTSSILTIPAAGTGLTYAYTTSTPLRANTLYDSASSAGTANQVLGAGSAGGTLTWRSLTNTSLGAIPQATNATVYQNQPVYYNTATQALNYIAVADDVIIQPCPATASPAPANRGTTYILTSAAGGSTFTINNTGGANGLTANDAGWYLYVKNGNPNSGGDITLNGSLVSGNTVVHNGTVLQNGQIVVVTWNGSAFVCY